MNNFIKEIFDLAKIYGFKVLGILILFFLGRWLIQYITKKIRKINQEHIQKHLRGRALRRQKTIEGITTVGLKMTLYSIIFLMILDLFNVKIGPLLAGAGIIGLAIGMGAQRLLQNLFAGLFIDDQLDIGDRVEIDGIQGKVVKLSIHSTVIQGDDGRLVYFPNGSINKVINFSQGENLKNQSPKETSSKTSPHHSSH